LPERQLPKTIALPQAIALYAGAVIGSGVLIAPGIGAAAAGPSSLVAWAFDGLLGIPLALTLAALSGRFPDAGGVAAYTRRAFGSMNASDCPGSNPMIIPNTATAIDAQRSDTSGGRSWRELPAGCTSLCLAP